MPGSKIKAKKQPKYLRELKQDIGREIAQKTRKRRQEELAAVMAKDKAETYGDVITIFYGLSKKAKDMAVFDRIFALARIGKQPSEIIEIMEPNNKNDAFELKWKESEEYCSSYETEFVFRDQSFHLRISMELNYTAVIALRINDGDECRRLH